MLRLFGFVSFLLIISNTTVMGQFLRIANQVEIPVPQNWYPTTDTTSFPFQLVHINDSAEILLFRSELRGDDMITSQEGLKSSVDLVVNDVISTLPDGQLRTSTGFYDGYRTGFVLEFVSSDSATGTIVEHSLKGILYRHPDDYQILFSIWGKVAAGAFTDVEEAIGFIQDEFTYQGDYEDEVFASTTILYWPLILVVMAVVGLLLLRPRRRKATAGSSSDISPPDKLQN